jgi:hypothetical protein
MDGNVLSVSHSTIQMDGNVVLTNSTIQELKTPMEIKHGLNSSMSALTHCREEEY